jgi:hypothetical protein
VIHKKITHPEAYTVIISNESRQEKRILICSESNKIMPYGGFLIIKYKPCKFSLGLIKIMSIFLLLFISFETKNWNKNILCTKSTK